MADPLLDVLNGGAAAGNTPQASGDPLLSLIGAGTPAPAPERNLPSVKAGSAINSVLSDIPHQLGLTARYGLEGLANTAQIFTEPIRYIQDKITPDRTPSLGQLVTGERTPKSLPLGVVASQFADAIGLPKPQNADERVIGDATRLVAGTGALGGAANLAAKVPGLLGQAGSFLGANMPQQIASAAGAGLAGGASREGGGNPLEQAGASLIGGVVGGLAPSAVNGAVNAVKGMVNRPNVDQQVSVALQRSGVDLSQIPASAQASLRSDVAKALNAGGELNPDAVRRLADFRATGLTPTRGMVTLDPAQITREQNLAKIGVNSSDSTLQTLGQVQNRNNAQLIGNLNDAGATRGDLFRAGSTAINAIDAADASMGRNVSELYSKARDLPGGNVPLDRKTLVDNIYGALAKENKLAFLPDNVSSMLDQISAGVVRKGGQEFNVPFDANALDNLMTTIATAQRGTQDGNVKRALSVVRQAIDGTPIQPVKNTFGGGQVVTPGGAQFLRTQDAAPSAFMDALNQARQAAAQRFNWRESASPIEAALNGAQPDNFVKRFVINGSVNDAEAIARNAPVQEVKDAILAHLKDKALNGASDEIGKFSQSSFNKALNEIGDRKLALFFSPQEVAQLKTVGRVASYAQVQPVGSAVNNSNSGALLLGKGYDALKAVLNKVPGGEALITKPLTNIEIAIKNRQAQNVIPGLLADVPKRPIGQGLLLPAAAVGGLLASP